MIIKTNPEFGVEVVLTTPYAYHNRDKVETIITSKGMKPFYYWCDDVREEFDNRTIDNKEAGLDELPNNWIHGVNPLEEPAVLDYSEWEVPPENTTKTMSLICRSWYLYQTNIIWSTDTNHLVILIYNVYTICLLI